MTISFPILGKFLTMSSSNIFFKSVPFSFSSFSWTPVIQMFVHLMLSQRSLRLSSFLFILFSLFCSAAVKVTYPFLCLSYSAIDSSTVFFIS